MTVKKGTGNIQTARRFGSYQLHLEWRIPAGITGDNQGRGNSGVYLQGRYEVEAVSTEAQGIGFAIPIDVARPIMEQAAAGEEITRPWIGVYFEPLTAARADELGINVDSGALVGNGPNGAAVVPGSPAEAAGLQANDVITAVDGEQLEEGDLAQSVLPHKPGDEVTLRIVRGQSTEEITITLGDYPAADS